MKSDQKGTKSGRIRTDSSATRIQDFVGLQEGKRLEISYKELETNPATKRRMFISTSTAPGKSVARDPSAFRSD